MLNNSIERILSNSTQTNDGTDPSVGMGTNFQKGTNPAVLNPIETADQTEYNVGQAAPTSFFE